MRGRLTMTTTTVGFSSLQKHMGEGAGQGEGEGEGARNKPLHSSTFLLLHKQAFSVILLPRKTHKRGELNCFPLAGLR